MSIKVQGKHSLKAGRIKVLNVQPTYGLVSVDIHGHVNRDTNGKLISRYLKNGWNCSDQSQSQCFQLILESSLNYLMGTIAVICLY